MPGGAETTFKEFMAILAPSPYVKILLNRFVVVILGNLTPSVFPRGLHTAHKKNECTRFVHLRIKIQSRTNCRIFINHVMGIHFYIDHFLLKITE